MISYSTVIIAIFALLLMIFGIYMIVSIGWLKGILATIARGIWLSPILFMLFPRILPQESGDVISNVIIRLFIDDSPSVLNNKERRNTLVQVEERLHELCKMSACQIKAVKLSSVDRRTNSGYSFLNENLTAWMSSFSNDPWVFITDGGDAHASLPWSPQLSGSGKERGLIVGFDDNDIENVWIESTENTPIAFESRPIALTVNLKRNQISSSSLKKQSIQVQIRSEKTILQTADAEFAQDDTSTHVKTMMAPLSRGQHFLTAMLIPTPGEKSIWDNQKSFTLEVLPNTLGVLHILGSPSWDGRFMRRFLKAEPKFDLISFFILRDPWDAQTVDEREMSLIPFPADRLFNEELSNFRVIVVQNFSMFQFLISEHQENLVRFVRNGGGLLFIGGSRSLSEQDLRGSPLRSILPFELPSSTRLNDDENNNFERSPSSKTYESEKAFKIQMSSINASDRSRVSLYDDLLELKDFLESAIDLSGLHRSDAFEFKSDASTHILDAVLADGSTRPLMVASYPDQGRAVWLFSDSFWKIAMERSPNITRDLYNQVFARLLRWLMRDEATHQLLIHDAFVTPTSLNTGHFTFRISGPSLRFLKDKDTMRVNVCDIEIPKNLIHLYSPSTNTMLLTGEVKKKMTHDQLCKAELEFHSPATGTVRIKTTASLPPKLSDAEISGSTKRLIELQDLTQANSLILPKDSLSMLDQFVASVSRTPSKWENMRVQNLKDYYWIFDSWYVYLVFSCLILEALVRRWDKIFKI